ncbi:hypothetical protein SAMD00019534_121610 [Acytostelium subglobosum LB1]|uniref:hypothetical protein n=1 Tax=Acytostelium subglobosum LB1 TaxID=1410327 RepID=UPI000644EF79|nr:hypothetical protein SAMD00019534_121610 [Acytostelium subglobosum LB1]GAM28985.1 hypothetical protein SAMD00019534_121610 [Acytostelium subglobosum LB1]|eukprot:XP_012747991.1 hypothetical protein SAMD00019534_121610 [Acytostelium subglobosum LB1]
MSTFSLPYLVHFSFNQTAQPLNQNINLVNLLSVQKSLAYLQIMNDPSVIAVPSSFSSPNLTLVNLGNCPITSVPVSLFNSNLTDFSIQTPITLEVNNVTYNNLSTASITLTPGEYKIDGSNFPKLDNLVINTIRGNYTLIFDSTSITSLKVDGEGNKFITFLNSTSYKKVDIVPINIKHIYPIVFAAGINGSDEIKFNNVKDAPYKFVFKGYYGGNPVNATKVLVFNEPCSIISVNSNEIICSMSADFRTPNIVASVFIQVGSFQYLSTRLIYIYNGADTSLMSCHDNGEYDEVKRECACDDGYGGDRCDSPPVGSGVQVNHMNVSTLLSFQTRTELFGISMVTIKEMNQYQEVVRIVHPIWITDAGNPYLVNVYTNDTVQQRIGNVIIVPTSTNSSDADSSINSVFNYEFNLFDYTYQSTLNTLSVDYELSTSSSAERDCDRFVYKDNRFLGSGPEYVRIAQGRSALHVNLSGGLYSTVAYTYAIKSMTSDSYNTTVFTIQYPYCNYCKMTMQLSVTDSPFANACQSFSSIKDWSLFIFVPLACLAVIIVLIVLLYVYRYKLFPNNDKFFDFE